MIIAIDGPAGAGKSTVARQVAQTLGLTYMDTGAMYRAVALTAQQRGLAPDADAALAELTRSLTIALSPLDADSRQKVRVNGQEVTDAIRTPEISQLTSQISAHPAVRECIVEQQRQMALRASAGVVLEGRDIGTVVFPDAEVKIFMTASAEERARRRTADLQSRGLPADYVQVLREQKERDRRDMERPDSPLIAAADALTLDTDAMTVPEVIAWIVNVARKHPSQSERNV